MTFQNVPPDKIKIKKSFLINDQNLGQKIRNKPFIGVYRDIIHYLDTDTYEVRVYQNDVTTFFGKLIQLHMMRDKGIWTIDEFKSQFCEDRQDINGTYLSQLSSVKQENKYLGIHSWEVGTGDPLWDNYERDIYGYPIQYDDIQDKWYRIDPFTLHNQEYHNSLYQRTRKSDNPSSPEYNQDKGQQFRKEVKIQLTIPIKYKLSDTSFDTDTMNIINKLRTGEYDIENVVEWEQYDGDPIGTGDQGYHVPEFILVQQVFLPEEQIFPWREFQLVQGFQKDNTDNPSYEGKNEQNLSIFRVNSNPTELDRMLYRHGTLVDYKIHWQINKTENMEITRQIVFGFLQVHSQPIQSTRYPLPPNYIR